MPTTPRRATSAAVVGLVGALIGAGVGLALGGLVGAVIGLPQGRLLSDASDEGFDQLDLALVVSFALWIAGALAGAWRRHRRTGWLATRGPVAALLLASLGASTTMVSSSAADWYVPLVVFGAPPLVVGVLAARTADQSTSTGD